MKLKIQVDNETVREFSAFLDEKMGLYFGEERLSDLKKKLLSISHSLKFEDPSACVKWLQNNSLESTQLDVLTAHLTIGETYFFRDEYFYSAMEKQILPKLIQMHQKDRKLRIWCAGCSSGEEIYSIAILLDKLLLSPKGWKLTLLATDINAASLQRAKEATYKKWSFRTIQGAIQERYFEANKDGTYTLCSKIREMVKFSYLNLAEDSYPNVTSDICEMDLILCHNVLIYFTEAQIKKTVQKFAKTLSKHGILSVAGIEAPFATHHDLTPCNYSGTIFHEKGIPQPLPLKAPGKKPLVKPHHVKKEILATAKPAEKREIKKEVKTDPYKEAHELYLQKKYPEVIVKLSNLITPHENDPEALKHLQQEIQLLIRTYANQGNHALGLKWCETALQIDKLQPLIHYFKAALLHTSNNLPEATLAVQRALFLDHEFIMAHYLLALLNLEQGHEEAAKKSFSTALQLLDQLPDGVKTLPGMEDFSIDHMKLLISNHL